MIEFYAIIVRNVELYKLISRDPHFSDKISDYKQCNLTILKNYIVEHKYAHGCS